MDAAEKEEIIRQITQGVDAHRCLNEMNQSLKTISNQLAELLELYRHIIRTNEDHIERLEKHWKAAEERAAKFDQAMMEEHGY